MRIFRKLSMAVVLTLAFAAYGFAGIIPTPPDVPPPPAPDSTASSVAASLVIVLVQSVVR